MSRLRPGAGRPGLASLSCLWNSETNGDGFATLNRKKGGHNATGLEDIYVNTCGPFPARLLAGRTPSNHRIQGEGEVYESRFRLHPSESRYQADKYDGPALRTFPWVRLYVGFITCTMTLTERGLWPQGHDQP